MGERDDKPKAVSPSVTNFSPTLGLVTRQTFESGPRWAVIGIFFHSSIGGGVLAVEIIRRADM